MAQISSSVGLVSGINYGQLISEMMSLDSQPIQLLQSRISSINAQQSAYSDLQVKLTSLQSTVQLLAKPSTIQNPTANSSNTSVLNATAAAGATAGTYQFQVARLVSTQQMISSGFSDQTKTPVGSATETLSAGSGALTSNAQLYQLNGATGVGAGSFTITDAAGNTATISTSGVASLSQLITKINASSSINVAASLNNNGIQLSDKSEGTGTLTVVNADSGDAADKLGLTSIGGATETGNVITGGNINTLGVNTTIQSLNGGLGVQTANGNDFQISSSDGASFSVNLTTMNSVQNVLDAINSASGNTNITASVSGSSLALTDNNGGTISVSALNASGAAKGLGLLGGTNSSGVYTGQTVLSPLNSVFISSLNGGQGLTMGAITVTNSDGANTIDLSSLTGANSVQDMIDAINATTGTTGISAQLNTAKNGIAINNVAGGNLTIANAAGSTMSTQLGITASNSTSKTIQGSNLGLATVSSGSISIEQGGAELNDATPLTQLNGGQGVSLGKIRVTDKAGQSDIIDLSSAVTVDDVVQQINSALDVNVTASVTNNGLSIVDNSTGTGSLSISNVGGDTTATSLGINTSSSTGTITGNPAYYLGASTALSQLNDGLGVRLSADNNGNDFTVSLASGATVNVDLTGAKTAGDVINDINKASAGQLTASINASSNNLVLTDNTTGSGTLSVSNSQSAQDLGLTTAANGNTVTGSAVLGGLDTVMLASLNGGSGFSPGDINFTNAAGQSASLNFAGATSMQDVIYDINNATDSAGHSLDLTAAIGTGGALQITDGSTGAGSLTIADATGSTLAAQLGIAGTFSGSATGTNTTPGVTPGIVSLTNRNGQSASINFAGAKTVQDVLNDINTATDSGGHSLNLSATLDSAGTGIEITDDSGGSGNLTIADTTGTLASQLGIAGTYDTSVANVTGTNLNRQFVNENTSLTSYNFGNGVNLGTFRITNSLGDSATVNLAAAGAQNIGDVIDAINSAKDGNNKSIGVTASLNAAGNGIELTDSAGGESAMIVADVTGTSAADLQISGTAAGSSINGAMQKIITVSPTDTLSTVASKINALGFGVKASVINDGSDAHPYRLSLTASNAGYDGRFIFDAGTTQLGSSQLVAAQDAAVFVGSSSSNTQPLLVTSKQNQITGIIAGLTVSLTGTSTAPVTVNVTTDDTQAVSQINTMVTTFNSLVDDIAAYSTFNTTTNEGGVLLGDYNTQNIQTTLYDSLNTIVGSTQQYHTLADLGFSFNNNGELQFDQSTFDQAYATNPDDVQKLLTATQTTTASDGTQSITPVGIMSQLSTTLNTLLDPTDGVIAQENTTLTSQQQNFQDQITQLNKTLANQQNVLENQFANLESTLSSLQSQSSTISSWASSGSSSSSSSSKS